MTVYFEGNKYIIPYEEPFYKNGCFQTYNFYLYFESLFPNGGQRYKDYLKKRDNHIEENVCSKV